MTVAIGTTGLNGFGREYLVLHLKDEGSVAFKELNAKPSAADPEATVVRRAARRIEVGIERHRA